LPITRREAACTWLDYHVSFLMQWESGRTRQNLFTLRQRKQSRKADHIRRSVESTIFEAEPKRIVVFQIALRATFQGRNKAGTPELTRPKPARYEQDSRNPATQLWKTRWRGSGWM